MEFFVVENPETEEPDEGIPLLPAGVFVPLDDEVYDTGDALEEAVPPNILSRLLLGLAATMRSFT